MNTAPGRICRDPQIRPLVNQFFRSLVDAPDLKLAASEIRRRSGRAKPVMVRFVRPAEEMRWIYDVVASEQTRQLLSDQAERNMFSRGLKSALESGPLPPLALLESHLAPGGALMTVDDEGLHYTGFTLRRNRERLP
jgi:hypothetical protein